MILMNYIFSNMSMILLMLIVPAQSRVDNVYRAGMPAYQYAGVKKVDPWLLYIKQSIRAALCSYFWIFMEEYSCLQLIISLVIYPA